MRADIESAVKCIETDRDRQLVMSFLKRYEKIYSLILKDSVKYRDEISKELQKVTKENKVANTYLDSSGY